MLVEFRKFNRSGATRRKLVADAPGSGEKIENIEVFNVIAVGYDVEETLPGIIGGRPGTVTRRRVDGPAPVFTAYYAQFTRVKRVR